MFEQNRDPNYFKEHQFNTNCGSFAFNICEWYCPDENFDEDDYELAYRLVDMECMDEYKAMCMLFERDLEQIHKDFKVKDVDGMDYSLKKDEELIAFRMCLNRSFWEDDLVVDYHFRVKRNGKWMECGLWPRSWTIRHLPIPRSLISTASLCLTGMMCWGCKWI